MALILHIETATRICSVALSENEQLLCQESLKGEGYVHGEQLTKLIQSIMLIADKQFNQLDAISISNGPGSYTGLRIGLSTVKGLAFAINCPIISLNTLDILAKHVNSVGNVFAMLDARRMEVYALGLNSDKEVIHPCSPVVINENSFLEFDPFYCIGDGIFKVKDLWKHRTIYYLDEEQISAAMQVKLASDIYNKKQFSDPATLVPDYLKDFYFTSK